MVYVPTLNIKLEYPKAHQIVQNNQEDTVEIN